MKILIIGEFSSFSKNLSSGFQQLGHECFVFSWGDGYKKIRIENSYLVQNGEIKDKTSIICRIKYYFHQYKERKKLVSFVRNLSKKTKFDVVLIINPSFICNKSLFVRPLFSRDMILSLVKSIDNIYLSSCGGDIPYYKYWSEQNAKNKGLVELYKNKYLNEESLRKFKYLETFVNKVIPIAYGYAEAWRNCELAKKWKICSTIPLPVDLTDIIPQNIVGDKILIFHGLNRYLVKGTQYIQAAMDRIQKEYPDRVECVIKGGVPLDEYKKILAKTNISVDQVYAFSTGMNGLYSLAMGKVLLGGNVPENKKEFKYEAIPTININADENQIYSQLKYIVEHPELITELSQLGRKYVEDVHEAKLIAQKYIDLFIKNGVNN